jgi:hypothetical protein
MVTPPAVTPPAPFRVDDATRREVERLLADGLLEPLLPGVVGPVGSSADPASRLAAAALAIPERVRSRATALAHAAAAWVWCGGPPPAVIDIAVPPHRSVPRLPAVAVHERRMPGDDVAVLATAGAVVPLTTPTRTLVDLLRGLPGTESPWVAPLVGFPGVTAESVAGCLERMPRARGVTRARTLAAGLPLARATPPGGPGARPAGERRSVDPLAGDPVGVEDPFHPPDGGDDVIEVRGVRHLEGKA